MSAQTQGTAWIIGRGGLLGSAVERRLRALRRPLWSPPSRVRWGDPNSATADLAEHWKMASEQGPDVSVYWCAGAGVTATTPEVLDTEVAVFEALLERLAEGKSLALFVASSAGGVYAGSAGAPFDESSEVKPLSPYGEARLRMERAALAWSTPDRRVLVGRLSNLYGPGQDVNKPQGLITQLLRAQLTRVPLQVYVSLDTLRDYLFVDDAARLVVSATDRLWTESPEAAVTKVLASQRSMSIADVLGELRGILQRRPQIVLGASPIQRYQAQDLRLTSAVWRDLDRAPITPFPVGAHATLRDLARRLEEGRLVPG